MAKDATFIDKLLAGIDNMKTLEIRTIVGDFKWDATKKKIAYSEGKVRSILTQIDLLEGDITTAMSPDFLEEPYDQLREFHADREKRGQEIIDGNIKALKELVGLVVTAVRSKKDVETEEEIE
jgi:hypothetical protein